MTDSDSFNSSSSTDSVALSSEDSDYSVPHVQLLLSRLKQAPVSSLNRKRKVAQNLPRDGKGHKSPQCRSGPKGVRPEQR